MAMFQSHSAIPATFIAAMKHSVAWRSGSCPASSAAYRESFTFCRKRAKMAEELEEPERSSSGVAAAASDARFGRAEPSEAVGGAAGLRDALGSPSRRRPHSLQYFAEALNAE